MRALWILLLLTAASAFAGTGVVYEKDSHRKTKLFDYKNSAKQAGERNEKEITFTAPDGKVAVHEVVVYEKGQLKSWLVENLQENSKNSVEVKDGEFHFRREMNGKIKTDEEKVRPDTIVGDQLGGYVAAHWDQLARGDDVEFRYFALRRGETVGFKFVKEEDTTVDGEPAMVVKMRASTWIIAAIVDPLYFTFSKNGDHRMMSYTGRTTPLRKDGDDWKDLDSETVYNRD